MKKKVLSLALALAMAMSLAAPAFASDLPEGWTPADGARAVEGSSAAAFPTAEEAEAYVSAKGWMTGTDKGFAPEQTVTRATVYEMFWKMEGKSVVNYALTYTDVPQGVWYIESARWATSEGLTAGTGNNHYDGDRTVTRAEVLTILYRYMKDYKGLDVSVEEGQSLDAFEDAGKLQSWGEDAMLWAVLTGVACQEETDATLDPETQVTRAELARMLTVMGKNMDGQAGDEQEGVTGAVSAISKYGNVTTDIPLSDIAAANFEVGDLLKVEITGQEAMVMPYGTGYSNVDQGSPLVLDDTDAGTLAMAINRGDFATTYGLGEKNADGATYTITAGKSIKISMAEKGGYLQEMELRAIDDKRTNERKDYASDEVFANFRAVTVGDVADGRLYRGSNPVNPEIGRNTYADALIREAGVKAALNLADSEETMKGYEGYSDSYYSTIAVKALNLGVDVKAADFNAGLKDGLVWLTQQEGPYYIHCTEGKDRAGFVAALLEMLCGATVEEITDDYMLSFENYYFVEKGTEQWDYIAGSNIEKSLLDITGAKDASELAKVDTVEAAEKYLTDAVGLSAEQTAALKSALTDKDYAPAETETTAPETDAPAAQSFQASSLTAKVDKEEAKADELGSFFTVTGKVTKRLDTDNGGVKSVELAKAAGSSIDFTLTAPATVKVEFSSTGSSNTSSCGIVDASGAAVKEDSGLTTVTGAQTGRTFFTYTNLAAGSYKIVSPADDNNRGCRVYSITVE